MKSKMYKILFFALMFSALFYSTAYATGTGDGVSTAIQSTWDSTKTQIKTVVDNVVFPALSLILLVLFFVKLAGAYFDYRKHGQFEFTAPLILFVCLIFSLVAPQFIWAVIGM